MWSSHSNGYSAMANTVIDKTVIANNCSCHRAIAVRLEDHAHQHIFCTIELSLQYSSATIRAPLPYHHRTMIIHFSRHRDSRAPFCRTVAVPLQYRYRTVTVPLRYYRINSHKTQVQLQLPPPHHPETTVTCTVAAARHKPPWQHFILTTTASGKPSPQQPPPPSPRRRLHAAYRNPWSTGRYLCYNA